MTPSDKPVTRETSAFVRDGGTLRAVVATIHGSVLILRAKGMRTREYVDLAAAYQGAVKFRVAAERAEKAAARKAKRKAR